MRHINYSVVWSGALDKIQSRSRNSPARTSALMQALFEETTNNSEFTMPVAAFVEQSAIHTFEM